MVQTTQPAATQTEPSPILVFSPLVYKFLLKKKKNIYFLKKQPNTQQTGVHVRESTHKDGV